MTQPIINDGGDVSSSSGNLTYIGWEGDLSGVCDREFSLRIVRTDGKDCDVTITVPTDVKLFTTSRGGCKEVGKAVFLEYLADFKRNTGYSALRVRYVDGKAVVLDAGDMSP